MISGTLLTLLLPLTPGEQPADSLHQYIQDLPASGLQVSQGRAATRGRHRPEMPVRLSAGALRLKAVCSPRLVESPHRPVFVG